MNKKTIDKVSRDLEYWRNKNHRLKMPRSELNETIKAFLLTQDEPGAKLKQPVSENYHHRHFDYVDDESVIQVDDHPNMRSIENLVYARDVLGKQPYWILALYSGKGGKALRLSMQAKIPLFRIYFRNNCYSSGWHS